MPAHPADGAIHRLLLGDAETAAAFSGEAELAAMLQVEGALAAVQGRLGLIPADAAAAIVNACRNARIDPAALADSTLADGVPIPGLVALLRAVIDDDRHAAFLHWGATSQDIVDTALMLRLKPVLALWRGRLEALLAALAALAERHAALPMAARTYGQAATPTSFGALVAAWGRPLIRHLERLGPIERDLLAVSLGGAAGTLAAMGPQAPQVRAALAKELGLHDPETSWHAERDNVAAFAGWMAGLSASLGKLGEDVVALSQSGIGEIMLEGAGGSSTMPQKRNPVGPSVLAALARHAAGLCATLTGAVLHRHQRDGAAWFTEWLTLPALCIGTGCALARALDVVGAIRPDAARMAAALDQDQGVIRAEALTFALAERLGRPKAQALVTALCRQALAEGMPLLTLAGRAFPDVDWRGRLTDSALLGLAPDEARAFAAGVRGNQR